MADTEQFARIALKIDGELHAEALECAASLRMHELAQYGRFAVEITNAASAERFNRKDTYLHTPHGLTSMPTLIVSGPMRDLKGLVFTGPKADKDAAQRFADRAGITLAERVRRSVRFTNFVVQNTVEREGEARRYRFTHNGIMRYFYAGRMI